jgi:hypothetical protein
MPKTLVIRQATPTATSTTAWRRQAEAKNQAAAWNTPMAKTTLPLPSLPHLSNKPNAILHFTKENN